jgi:allantoinase
VTGEKIKAIEPFDAPANGAQVIDAGNRVVMPGLVDPHVHINEPGRTEWEGFAAATRAAAAGGFTTLVDMPLNSIPATTTLEALETKRKAAAGQCFVDVEFWGGIVPGNASEIRPMFETGVVGFKCYLLDPGVGEFPPVTEADLRRVLPILNETGALILVHAELPGPIELARRTRPPRVADCRSYRAYLASRPHEAETDAIKLCIRLCREFGVWFHFVHVSTGKALEALEEARDEGLLISAETCPHYLCVSAEEILNGDTLFKCAPPVRESPNRHLLWRALNEGTIDLIASDHSPSPADMKCLETGDFDQAWGGIASLQLTLPVIWSEARRRGIGFPELARWMGTGPASLAGLDDQKGAISPGWDADIIIWDPDEEFEVTPDCLYTRHRLSPYIGRRLCGVVHTTYLRGEIAYDRGQFPGGPRGILLEGNAGSATPDDQTFRPAGEPRGMRSGAPRPE